MNKTNIDTSTLSLFRFLAVLTVIFIHYGQDIENWIFFPFGITRGGSIITFFFILSGFGLYLGYHKKDRIELRSFFLKRTTRILPFYYMALLMMALMLLISGRFSILKFLLASLCLQPWLPNFQHSINPPGWFVADLLFFYSLFPLVFYFIKRNKPNANILIISSILLWIFSLFIHNTILSGVSENYYNYIDCLPISWFCSFYMGICGAYYIKSVENNRIVRNDSIIYTLILIVLCSLVIIVHQGEIAVKFENYMPFEANLYAPLLLLLIMHLSVSKNHITKILSLRFFALLATISYPLYIFQAPVHNGFSYIFNRFLEFQPDVFFTIFIVFFMIFTSILSFMEIRFFNWLSDRILQKSIKP